MNITQTERATLSRYLYIKLDSLICQRQYSNSLRRMRFALEIPALSRPLKDLPFLRHFVRSGSRTHGISYILNTGATFAMWSSMARSTNIDHQENVTAYYLSISDKVRPYHYAYGRFMGNSLRCLVR